MKPPIQVVCTDFDGTVFAEFEHRPIPDCLVEQIGQLQAQGAKWVINTGRDLSGLMEALGRSHIPVQPDYLVLVEREIYVHNGASYRSLRRWNDSCQTEHNHLFRQVRLEVPSLTTWIASNHNATIYEDAFSPFCLIAETNDEADRIYEFLQDFASQIPCPGNVRGGGPLQRPAHAPTTPRRLAGCTGQCSACRAGSRPAAGWLYQRP